MADYQRIYDQHADAYDALVSREDHEQNLLAALRSLCSLDGIDVVETGAGTGRVTLMLAPFARSVRAFDRSAHMLSVAEKKLAARGASSVRMGVASHDALPVEDACADLAIEGWAFGHVVGWNPSGWVDELEVDVRELSRTLRPGGTMVLIETMGTGVETPFEGGHALEVFHRHLVERMGFAHRCIRTDYAFESVEDAAEKAGFFFGEKMAEKVRARGWRVLPECTGLYWRGV